MPTDGIGINRTCSGRSGLDAQSIARIQDPSWRPMEHIESNSALNALVPRTSCRPGRPSRVCIDCGKPYTLEPYCHSKRCMPCRSERVCARETERDRARKAKERAKRLDIRR